MSSYPSLVRLLHQGGESGLEHVLRRKLEEACVRRVVLEAARPSDEAAVGSIAVDRRGAPAEDCVPLFRRSRDPAYSSGIGGDDRKAFVDAILKAAEDGDFPICTSSLTIAEAFKTKSSTTLTDKESEDSGGLRVLLLPNQESLDLFPSQ